MKQIVRTRIAPSPTGEDLHIGNVYTALFNYAFAKKQGGAFIVRIEDTDQARYVAGTEARILKSLQWAGIKYTEGPDMGGPHAPYRQSERLAFYKKYAEELVSRGQAYYCFCTSKRLESVRKQQQAAGKPTMYDGKCKEIPAATARKLIQTESYVVRLKVPDEGETVVTDMIRGKIRFQNALLDDQVLIKSDGYPTYHLAVVVDDHLMEITHVIRGEDWISSTPKHVILYWALGWQLPYYAHLPLLRNPDHSKLSKRKNPVWTSWYREQGFLPEALVNYLSTLTWSMPDGRDIFSLKDMIQEFKIEHIKTTAPIFNFDKLAWLNGEYIRLLTDTDLIFRLKPFVPPQTPQTLVKKLAPLAKERMKKLSEFTGFLEQFTRFTPVKLDEAQRELVSKLEATLTSILPWKTKAIEAEAKRLVEMEKLPLRDTFMALRLAVTGEKVGLPLFETMEILGKAEVLKRLAKNV